MALTTNYVGLLQERCVEYKIPAPKYSEVETDDKSVDTKKFVCAVDSLTTEGSGYNKKLAKQNAAELMVKKLESNACFMTSDQRSPLVGLAMKINVFCDKNGKDRPSCVIKEKENGLFVVQYTMEGYTVTGKGICKKAAAEQALEEISNHFNVDVFFANMFKRKERLKQQMNSTSKLLQHCQIEKLPNPSFHDEKVIVGKTPQFVVTCTLNDLVTKSNINCSKKEARLEASALMLKELNKTTFKVTNS